MIFKDRFDAAERLAEKLQKYKGSKDGIILAIPRGALQTGYVLAKRLQLPLDIILTKKIGHPDNSELAIGAVSLTSEIIDPDFRDVSREYIKKEVKEIRQNLRERSQQYRGTKFFSDLKDKIVILVDDGIATGHTMSAAIDLVKEEKLKKIIVAIPVGPWERIEMLKKRADEVICLSVPENFTAIGQFYRDFPQVDDEEAIGLLRKMNE